MNISQSIREALGTIPIDVSHSMSLPPEPSEIYAPSSHSAALDPTREIVVGGRGMGKSFWAGAYVSPSSRALLTEYYPKLELDKLLVTAGFTGEEGGTAPSRRVLDKLEEQNFTAEDIWRAVVWRATSADDNQSLHIKTWEEATRFIRSHPEVVEQNLAAADRDLRMQGRRLIVVFDALDRLGVTWATIRRRSAGLLRTALAMRSYRTIRFKIFFRPDQYDDHESLFAFPDASKLRASAVQLKWEPVDLYGLLFHKLLRDPVGGTPFRELVRATLSVAVGDSLPRQLREEAEQQERSLFRLLGVTWEQTAVEGGPIPG